MRPVSRCILSPTQSTLYTLYSVTVLDHVTQNAVDHVTQNAVACDCWLQVLASVTLVTFWMDVELILQHFIFILGMA